MSEGIWSEPERKKEKIDGNKKEEEDQGEGDRGHDQVWRGLSQIISKMLNEQSQSRIGQF